MVVKHIIKRNRIIVLILFFSQSLATIAQDATDEPVRIEVVKDRWEDKIIISFTNDMWLNLPQGVELRTPSIGFKAHLFSDYAIKDGIVSFAWGLGVSSDNVHSNAAFLQESFEDGTTGEQILTPFSDEYAYEKNKFVATYIELPVELRLITKGRGPFKLAAGFKIGYMVSNHHKIIDTEGKRKFYDFDEIEKFRYGVTARLGVGKIQLTGFYSLVPLIAPENGTDVIPVSVGLSFTPIR